MDTLLIEFINTFDLALKKQQKEAGDRSGFSALTISQLQYIDAIHSLGEPTITTIAEKLNITKASVTASVKKLISMGYVTKTRSNEDNRVFNISLTKAGEILVDAKYQALKEYGDFITTALTEDEARRFEKILTKLVKLFEQT